MVFDLKRKFVEVADGKGGGDVCSGADRKHGNKKDRKQKRLFRTIKFKKNMGHGGTAMVFITGDTHGEWVDRLNTGSFPDQKKMTKGDYVIILGDFGIWDNSRKENYNLDWLEDKPFTTLFISGNHENYDILDSLPVNEWNGGKVNYVRPSVIHLMRGQVFRIADKSFFAFGGAASHDIKDGILEPDAPDFKERKLELDLELYALYRVNHVSWWERELPNSVEMDEGLENLHKQGDKVDYIITHSPYTSLLEKMDKGMGTYKRNRLTDYLQRIKQNAGYGQWFFGHMHVNRAFPDERSACLYEDIVRIL